MREIYFCYFSRIMPNIMQKTIGSIYTGLTFLLLLQVIIVNGQGTKDDYLRAENLAETVRGKVFYANVRPVWIGNRGVFLYENQIPGGTEYIIVDPERKTKGRAFDQARFAAALTQITGKKHDPLNLPVGNILFSERRSSFAFIYDEYNWICNLKDYSIVKGDRVTPRRANGLIDWSFRDELSNGPVASPDKLWIAFIRDYNVWIRQVSDSNEYQLSYDGGLGEYYSSFIKWSPDSRFLTTNRVRPAEKHFIHYIESSPANRIQPRHYSFEYPKPGDALPQFYPKLFDALEKKQIAVTGKELPDQYAVNNISWDKSGSSFTYEYNRRGHQQYQVIRVDAFTGKSDVIINEVSETFIDYSGKKYRYNVGNAPEIIWASERDGWNHLYLYDSNTGEVKNQITRGDWVVRDVSYVNETDRQIVFSASGKEPGDPYFLNYYIINFDGSDMRKLTMGDGTHQAFFSPDRKYFVDTWSSVDSPPVTVLRKTEDGSIVMPLEKADVTELVKTGIRFPEPFSAKGRDGKTDIWGIIIRPVNFSPSIKYPVIEYIYAGPHSSHVPKNFRAIHGEMHALAELGFIVVQIDGMGTSNRSKAFHDVCWKNLKDAGFPDRIRWIKAAAEKYSYLDTTRVGIYGGSAGGQNAAGALLFHPEFYKVGSAACGCHDNRMDKIWWNEQWMGWPVGEEYASSSNIENAWRLKGRLLLINGELDDNVDPASTVQFVDALIKAGKDFEYVFVPGARHISSGGDYGIKKRRDFFVKNLLGIEPPVWDPVVK